MLHKDIPIAITVSSGVGNQNTDNLCSSLMKLVLVTSATTTNTFDVKILDSGSRVVYHKEGITGVLRDEPETPLRDRNTIRIENAVIDELFEGKLTVTEVF